LAKNMPKRVFTSERNEDTGGIIKRKGVAYRKRKLKFPVGSLDGKPLCKVGWRNGFIVVVFWTRKFSGDPKKKPRLLHRTKDSG